jgi:hypothetical protein
MQLPAHRFSCLLLPPEALLWLVVGGGMLLWSANKNGVRKHAAVHVDTIVLVFQTKLQRVMVQYMLSVMSESCYFSLKVSKDVSFFKFKFAYI